MVTARCLWSWELLVVFLKKNPSNDQTAGRISVRIYRPVAFTLRSQKLRKKKLDVAKSVAEGELTLHPLQSGSTMYG